jgi:hypothetical protein
MSQEACWLADVQYQDAGKKITRLERWTLWSTLKFQRCSLCHIKGDDISRATKGITNATMLSKTTVLSNVTATTIWTKVIVAKIFSSHCCNNMMKDMSDMEGPIRYSSFMFKCKEHLKRDFVLVKWKN